MDNTCGVCSVVGFPTDDPKCTYLHMERVLFCSAGRPSEMSYGESMLLTTEEEDGPRHQN